MKKTFLKMVPLMGILLVLAGCPGSVEEVVEITEPLPNPDIAVLVTEGFHDGEAYMPMGYLVNKGFDVTVIGPEAGRVKAYNSDFEIVIEWAVSDVSVDNFDALILPGGRAPAALREDPEVVAFVTEFFETGKPVAAICHGPQVLATAGVLEGMTCSGVGSIQEELEAAGATYLDEALVIDDNLITSRVPGDLALFSKAIEDAVNESFDPEIPRAIPPQPGM
ncbi:MAG: type 1 glutamine amidotransferase domain-containing protein [Bacteroidales bacterium]